MSLDVIINLTIFHIKHSLQEITEYNHLAGIMDGGWRWSATDPPGRADSRAAATDEAAGARRVCRAAAEATTAVVTATGCYSSATGKLY